LNSLDLNRLFILYLFFLFSDVALVERKDCEMTLMTTTTDPTCNGCCQQVPFKHPDNDGVKATSFDAHRLSSVWSPFRDIVDCCDSTLYSKYLWCCRNP